MNLLPQELESMINIYKNQLENHDKMLNEIKNMKKEYRNIIGNVHLYFFNQANKKILTESIFNYYDKSKEYNYIIEKKILTVRNHISVNLNNEINNKIHKKPIKLRKLYEGEIIIFNKNIECI
jgi:hypothetical protein